MTDEPDIRVRLLALDTPTLSDALDALGHNGAVTGLVALTVRGRVAGRVRTVRLGAPAAMFDDDDVARIGRHDGACPQMDLG